MSKVNQDIEKESSGKLGFDYIDTSSSPGTGKYSYLVPDIASTFSADSEVGSNLLSQARREGVVIAGNFTNVAVTVGAVRAYKTGN